MSDVEDDNTAKPNLMRSNGYGVEEEGGEAGFETGEVK